METNDIRAASFVMTNEHAVARKISPSTWIGLFLSLFAMVVIRYAFVFFVPEMTFASAILKETLIWFGHWSGGAANILIALAAGIILTGFYLWRRDLVANMIGHGLVAFVANVLPKLFS